MKISTWKLASTALKRFHGGYPWIFANELARKPPTGENFDLISLIGPRDEKLGLGFGNPHSLIVFRTLQIGPAYTPSLIVSVFFEILEAPQQCAMQLRLLSLGTLNQSFRCVYAEADHIPGLIIDHYFLKSDCAKAQRVLVVQILNGFFDRHRNELRLFEPHVFSSF